MCGSRDMILECFSVSPRPLRHAAPRRLRKVCCGRDVAVLRVHPLLFVLEWAAIPLP